MGYANNKAESYKNISRKGLSSYAYTFKTFYKCFIIATTEIKCLSKFQIEVNSLFYDVNFIQFQGF